MEKSSGLTGQRASSGILPLICCRGDELEGKREEQTHKSASYKVKYYFLFVSLRVLLTTQNCTSLVLDAAKSTLIQPLVILLTQCFLKVKKTSHQC